ncbi:MAG: hypothetical protein ABJ242_07860 [Marinomonas sp.]
MTGLFASMLPIALLMTADQSVLWLDDTRLETNVVLSFKQNTMMPNFAKAEKILKNRAKEACASKQLGEPKIEGEVMVTAISMTPEGQRQVTLSATYACK